MRILISGASGLIGSALGRYLPGLGHEIIPLPRTAGDPAGANACWNPETGRVHLGPAEPLDAVIHLAAENIGRRWTPELKRRIGESRIAGTRFLGEAIARLSHRPQVLISASAVGIYGDRSNDRLTEESPAGDGFLAEFCRAWEASAVRVDELGIRVVCLRLGMVLSPGGGALAKMLPIFKWGLGGRLGSGTQFWSWITLEDVVRAIGHALAVETMSGPVNLVSPNPVTNQEFTRTLGDALNRPTCFPVPRWAVEGLFGEMGRQVLLASARVHPARLLNNGFQFRHPDLEPALHSLLD